MARTMRVTLLGTGTSTGVPVIGCRCRVCVSTDPRDTRSRSACYVRIGELGIVIDTGPDFRLQMLRERVTRIDAVLFTHHHFDHVVGVDDLRPYFFGNLAPMACYAHPHTAGELIRMFPYLFPPRPGAPTPWVLEAVKERFTVGSRYGKDESVWVQPLEIEHGTMSIYGYRIESFAYITDASAISEETFGMLEDLDVLVINGLRRTDHPRHFTIAEAVRAAQRIGARQTYLSHMTHTVLHAEEEACAPAGVQLGYDGLTFNVNLA